MANEEKMIPVFKALKVIGLAIGSGIATGLINYVHNLPPVTDYAIFLALIGLFEAVRNYRKHKTPAEKPSIDTIN